jgi:DNA polymerase I
VRHFNTIVVCDFEYEVADGELPNVLSMVAFVLDANLQHVDTIERWRGEFGATPPFDIGDDTLFVAYSAWAEMTCFMTLGWSFPKHVFDQHTAYLAASNVLLPYDPDLDKRRKKPRKRLADACRAYGIEGWEHIDKEVISKDIGEGRWQKYGREGVLNYNREDVRAETLLFRAQLLGRGASPPADILRVLRWSEYASKAIARIQARGIPFDMPLWNLVLENKSAVILQLLQQLDPSHGDDDPIYTPDGSWETKRFERWLIRQGVTAWPRLDSGRLDLEGDAFKLMYHIPGIEELHALRDSLRIISKANLPIGKEGRNRPSLFPFGTATGRNGHSRSIFNTHAGMYPFIRFPEDRIGVNLDWRTQEVGIAASRSGDKALIEAYLGGDVYHALARLCGLTNERDPKRWKDESPEVRQRMKALQLGINYGMGITSLAKGLNRHPAIASGIVEDHKRAYPRFWEWREQQVQRAMLDRKILTSFGWPLRITTSPNKRSLYNFPMQGDGGEMLRMAAVELCEANIVPCMLVHDGILLEVESLEQREIAVEIMRKAGLETCNGLEIGVDKDQTLMHGERYRDKRPVAQKMWKTMMRALQQVGALPEGELP